MTDQVIGIIPARYGSTRFPGKPLVTILGKTLLQRTYENAQRASLLTDLLVATDDQRIFDHVKAFGGKVVMTAVECPTGTDRLAEVIQHYPGGMQASVIINIQGDEPCLNPIAIDLAAQALINDPQGNMSTIVTPLRSEEEALSPSIVKCVMDQKGNALYFSRGLIPSNKKHAFQASASYFRHLGLYAYRPSFLLEYQKLPLTPLQLEEDLEQLKVLEHGYRIKVAVVDEASIGVDTPDDIYKVEQWLCKQNTSL
ncbi:3-deoxy-manno-octulosonate cytidylyltransferase [Candidatus Protochlamydia phocaeensis]|uniref:3-deoxy-manno-octulosonate cytidylyltransferase n=1 Tax=Candidatus Protochlamydia phocaeensis TaxID=1414722 RepID=UPI000837DCD9|nr:3-deoxy-manno-octulosonate cytidylyltransferase [Candidatus Protochlamydia phocaeensis]